MATINLGSAPRGDPLVSLTEKLRSFFGQPWVQTKYGYEGTDVPVVADPGWRSRQVQLNADPAGANRLVLMPGWGLNGKDLGSFTQPIRSSSKPRTLATQRYNFTLSAWAVDNSDVHNDGLQAAAAWSLVQSAWQGLSASATANVLPGGKNYRDDYSVNLSYGWEILAEFTVLARIYDFPLDQSVGVTPTVIKENPPWPSQ